MVMDLGGRALMMSGMACVMNEFTPVMVFEIQKHCNQGNPGLPENCH